MSERDAVFPHVLLHLLVLMVGSASFWRLGLQGKKNRGFVLTAGQGKTNPLFAKAYVVPRGHDGCLVVA